MPPVPRVAVLLDRGRSFDRGLMRGIGRYVSSHGPWSVLQPAAYYQRFSGLGSHRPEVLRREQVDGLITSNVSAEATSFSSLGIPTIAVPADTTIAGAVPLLCDNRCTAERAADHLLDLGLGHFAFAGLDQAIWSLQRHEAFGQRIASRGFTAASFLAPLRPSARVRKAQRRRLRNWLAELPKPVGVMACNDDYALLLFDLCREGGISVPDDVAIVGVDNDELICALTVPSLTSVAFVTEQSGYEAAAALDAMMSGGTPPKDIRVPAGRVVCRASTNVLRIDDEEVAKALRFIRTNAHRSISVGDVVDATLLSQWSLGRRFRSQLGRTIRKEINRRRAEFIAGLLQNPSLSVDEVALEAGYPNQAHLARFLSREIGMTPREYRKR